MYAIFTIAAMRSYRVFLSFFLTLAVAACDSANRPSVASVNAPKAQSEKNSESTVSPMRIALVMKTLTNPFFVKVEHGARQAEKEFGIELMIKAASQETSIEQQIQIVEELIQEKTDAIVIAPGDSSRLVPVLKKAQLAGIRIITIDNQLDSEALKSEGVHPIPFISVDNEMAAYQSAKFVAEQVKNSTKAFILEGIRSAENSRQRTAGAERAFHENAHIRIVAKESANWKIDEGYAVTKRVFATHPDITVIFAANDMMALGASKYLQETENRKVRVAAYDAIDDAKEAVKSGKISVTVDQQAAEQGYQGIAMAVRALRGEPIPESILVDTRLITANAPE